MEQREPIFSDAEINKLAFASRKIFGELPKTVEEMEEWCEKKVRYGCVQTRALYEPHLDKLHEMMQELVFTLADYRAAKPQCQCEANSGCQMGEVRRNVEEVIIRAELEFGISSIRKKKEHGT